MSQLLVRRLMIDMDEAIARDWCDGDAFRSAFLNALSMSFPQGEQFFMDAVRDGVAQLPPAQREAFAAEVKGFVGQEATHRHLHAQYNRHLKDLGYVNHWERRILKRRRQLEGKDLRHWLATTAAYEHFTAILAAWLLEHPEVLGQRDPRLKTLWLWHSAEESEHRSVAFDVYRALGGNELWRKRWFRLVTWFLITDLLRQTVHHLRRDGQLWRRATWRSAWRLLFGATGLVRDLLPAWRAYFAADFHPAQDDDAASRAWLNAHQDAYRVVGQAQPSQT